MAGVHDNVLTSDRMVKLVVTLAVLTVVQVEGLQLTNRLFQWTRLPEDYPSDGKAMTGHSIMDYSHKYVTSQCALECLRHQDCQSFNFDRDSGRCELNSANHRTHPADFVDKADSEYHERESFHIHPDALGPCASNPCNSRGHCIETKNSGGDMMAVCLCHEGWTGSGCQTVANALGWGEWEEWGECSATCHRGWRMRKRMCMDHVTGKTVSNLECFGADVEYDACLLQDCPKWDQWALWEQCSASETCGQGTKLRHRKCANGGVPGVDRYCLGSTNQSAPCSGIDCIGAMRLQGGTAHGEGRLEIYNNLKAEWGQVCADQLTPIMADLACTQMGMPGAHAVVTDGRYGGPTEIALTEVRCGGGEQSLLQCRHDDWNLGGTCNTGADVAAGLQCNVDGVWSLWTSWSDCSVTCENGTRHRTRMCNHPPQMHGGKACEGEDIQYKPCTLKMCPINGVWNPWTDWSPCSTTCGNGTQDRTRDCHGPFHQGLACSGEDSQRQRCMPRDCPVDGVWEEWADWSECSLSCGNGTRWRQRTCTGPFYGGQDCPGSPEHTENCNTFECPDISVDGVWQAWSDWGACSVTCADGVQHRSRTCRGPFHGGQGCQGEEDDSQTCNPRPCPVDGLWMGWAPWAKCSASCGGGSRMRTRQCGDAQHGGRTCEGEGQETEACGTRSCQVDGVWLPWADWGQCSKTCGKGERVRIRDCEGPFFGGANCTGPWDDTEFCNPQPCPVDGVWEEWVTWSECSLTCGGGSQSRNRSCIGPFYGGAECPGAANQTRACNEHNCPVDGYYLQWSAWGACSVTCGGGAQDRQRTCVPPQYGGQQCQGPAEDRQECNTQHCPVDGFYHEWSDWGECSLTCGGGIQLRDRECEMPKYGGADCVGPPQENQDCNTQPCPVDGVWKAWSPWSACNTTCGGGMQERVRECEDPQHGGADCEGHSAEYLPCSDNPCPIPGDWFLWSPWSECTTTCGGGERERSRECDMTSYGDLTAPCEPGGPHEVEDCHTYDCTPYARTCSQWQERGLTASTLADIDPDGETGDLDPVQVDCDLDTQPGDAITVIGHNSEEKTQVQGWEGAREYEQIITYNISFDHVVSIIDQSRSCAQYIRWDCKAALIHNPNDNNKVTTGWLNRTEQLSDYFGGAAPGSSSCACGMDLTCAEPDLLCNCDKNDGTWRFDAGDLTFKQDLPVTAFVAGDTGGQNEDGYRTVGTIRCLGAA